MLMDILLAVTNEEIESVCNRVYNKLKKRELAGSFVSCTIVIYIYVTIGGHRYHDNNNNDDDKLDVNVELGVVVYVIFILAASINYLNLFHLARILSILIIARKLM